MYLRACLYLVLWHCGTSSRYHFAAANNDDDYTVAEVAPFVTFNHGDVTSTAYCTTQEMASITSQVRQASASGYRHSVRRLGRSQNERDLLTKCTPLLSWATTKCGGSLTRRRLQEEELSNDDRPEDREEYHGGATDDDSTDPANGDDHPPPVDLVWDQCTSSTNAFNKVLDGLQSRLSAPCRAFVRTRSFECLEVMDCDIKSMTIWDASDSTGDIHKLKAAQTYGDTELVYCTTDRMDFQAKTSFDVGNVKFTLTGPDNGDSHTSWDHEAPYFMFGTEGIDNMAGTELSEGQYTLTAVAANEPDEPQTVHFRIVEC